MGNFLFLYDRFTMLHRRTACFDRVQLYLMRFLKIIFASLLPINS